MANKSKEAKKRKPLNQRDRFIKTAREAECSEDEVVFDATLKKIGSHKPGAPILRRIKSPKK